MKHRLIDDLEKIYSYYNNYCKLYDYDCMKCKLCSLNSETLCYNFLCDMVCELILSMRKYYKENDIYEK